MLRTNLLSIVVVVLFDTAVKTEMSSYRSISFKFAGAAMLPNDKFVEALALEEWECSGDRLSVIYY